MKTSSILSLRQLASRIHPPLPLSPRESQKLLSLLSASFREQLDKEHGKASSSSLVTTDKLLSSILINPLLGLPPQQRSSPLNGARRKQGEASAAHSRLIQEVTMSPTERFKMHIAAGSASLEMAKNCLSAQLRSMPARETENGSSTPTSGFSATILNWLWSSGHEEGMDFLRDQSFTRVLVSFLVAEGRALHAWSWFRRLQLELQKDTSGEAKAEIVERKTKSQTHLLKALIWSEMTYSTGLNGALRAFVETLTEFSYCGATMDDVTRRVFYPTGSLLLARLMKMDTTAAIDHRLVEKLLRTVKSWSECSAMDSARLLLSHPLSPDPYPALDYIHSSMTNPSQLATFRERRDAVALCLRTSEVLINEGNNEDAQWVLQFVQGTFPQELGLRGPDSKQADEKNDRISSETASLQQLEALAFG